MTQAIAFGQYGAMGQQAIGHIDGVIPGEAFASRVDMKHANLHSDVRRGISRLKDSDGSYIADAIVLNGGYEDDDDDWTTVRYTGASPDDEKDGTKLLKSQSWEYRDNAALKLSFDRGHPVRIFRGPKGDRRYSLPNSYRYDGLYKITAARDATAKSLAPDGAPIKICQFILERLSDPEQELTPAERQIAEVLVQQEELLDIEAAVVDGESNGQTAVKDGEAKPPATRVTRVQRIVRDPATVQRIKVLYDHECQMCGLRLVGPDGKPYSEGAHIKPLGKPHHGPDVERNILCLCPNCHVRLDIGAVLIEEDWSIVARAGMFEENLRVKLKMHRKHKVHMHFIEYHRDWWGR
ncbi:YDG/SRA domain-containing protein [Streptomyces sp. NPDC048254]|uniref:YDG/SRA domain-containing protein n=1 Tax=Streptomyces sp. NPDC048254 TaxID=3365525 RepID=UPI0037248D95